jgi:hypothetical protein
MAFAGNERHRATQGQVHADTNFAIIQKCHSECGLLGLPAEGAEAAEGNGEALAQMKYCFDLPAHLVKATTPSIHL